ncbi:hypothetical protein BT93_E1297 [Corymbia citriodora subsp. variegata]|nr:hypothetical protein BT93_E1297 [Corymbia citriodora subsp. variegata]
MEGCSRAVESLDSLWLFSNVLSRSRPLPPAAEAEETEEKEGEGEEPVKNQASGPEEEAARAKPVATTTEDSPPACPRCRNVDAGVAELGATTSSTKEAVGTPGSAEEESKLKERMEKTKRRQRSKRMFHERRRSVLGELDLGCDGEEFSGFEENRFLVNRRQKFGVAELGATTSSTEEAVGTPGSAEEEPKLGEKVRRSRGRQRSRRTFYEELDLGCFGEEFSGFEENRFLVDRRRLPGFGVASGVRAMQKMPPLSDGIAMREHLRSWAIAVACAVK